MAVNTRRSDCSKLIQDLMERYSLEELAIKCGVTANSVYKWSKGRQVSKPVANILKRL